LALLRGLFAPRSISATPNTLIRATTLSPVEWRRHRERQLDVYQRWLRPLLLLSANRLHLRPNRIEPHYLTQAGIDHIVDALELRVIRLITALFGAVLGCAAALLLTGTFLVVPLLAWLGYIAPLRVLAARRRKRQAALQRDLPEFIGLLRAFVTAGLPLERTLHVLSANAQPDSLLKCEIRAALARYGLGSSIDQALEEIGPRTGVDDLTSFLSALVQTKRSGSGLEATLRDQEFMVRMNQRNRVTGQAAAISTKLLAVLAGVYLPEFVILIIIPLFWGIFQRAFG
jgi:tight adherence protein C